MKMYCWTLTAALSHLETQTHSVSDIDTQKLLVWTEFCQYGHRSREGDKHKHICDYMR